ncbi:hypothetical protein Drose_04225 [Dactylosporangium roseum]|uniref:Uncharacterized protein n=1 Tax=Dactylosporangium roseum TaxID=47989 RepID=A0ABY5Z649_9ACTN|nr:hypothetical protein [Dactylosporangium roseum]UWZ37496.1 hypothetical protein Drose_04225 [Dactylosporangium roseum]
MSAKTHMFDSRAQQRWAFATHQKFAHRWGENTKAAGWSKTLPARTRPKSARSLMTGHAGR